MPEPTSDYVEQARQIVADGPHGLEECDMCGAQHCPPASHVHELALRLEHELEILVLRERIDDQPHKEEP